MRQHQSRASEDNSARRIMRDMAERCLDGAKASVGPDGTPDDLRFFEFRIMVNLVGAWIIATTGGDFKKSIQGSNLFAGALTEMLEGNVGGGNPKLDEAIKRQKH